MLGLVDRRIFAGLAAALLAGDLEKSLALLDESYSSGLDLKRFAGDLLRYFRSLLICQNCSNPAELLDVSDEELKELTELAGAQSKETVYRTFQLLMQGVEEMRYASHPRLTMELAFIKAIQAGQVVPASTLLGRLDALIQEGNREGSGQTAAVMAPPSPEPQAPVALKQSVQTEKIHTISPPAASHEPKKETVKALMEEDEKKETSSPPEEVEAQDDVPIATHVKDVRKNWNEFSDYVKDRKQWMAQVLRLCENPREENEDLVIRFDNPSDCLLLKKPDNLKDLTRYAQDFFQKELRVKITTKGREEESSNGDDGASAREERRALANDPLVKMVTEIFDGKVSAIRTGPRFR